MSSNLRSRSPDSLKMGTQEKKVAAVGSHFQDNIKDNTRLQINAALSGNQADTRVWELLTNVPRVKNYISYICMVLNVLFPGSGTIVAACAGDWEEGAGGGKQT